MSVRAQILNLLDDLKRSSNLAMVFISHDLGVVRHLVDRIAVMYRGRIVEIGPTDAIFSAPRHPYTSALLSAMPVARVGARRPRGAATAPDRAEDDTAGCPYVSRCPLAFDQCRRELPPLEAKAANHLSACFRAGEVLPPAAGEAPLSSAAADRLTRLQNRFAARVLETAEAQA